jgi:molybdate transport system substrate-binding protein
VVVSRTRSMVVLLGVVSMLGLSGAAAGHPSVVAQGASFECPAPAAPASPQPAPDAAASPVAVEAAFLAEGGDLTVFAAASLTDAFEQIEADLEAANPGLMITYNFGGSPALVTQLAEGAAADVFASANIAQMQAAIANGSISGEPVTFVHNRLAIVTPRANPAGISSPADLARPDLLLVLAQADIPAGRYAREAVCAMGADPGSYGEDFVARVAANVVSEEEDVRDVLAKVAIGEADAGIVYVSDAAAAATAVQLIDIPTEVNIVATYPIAAVTGGDESLANAFIAYVRVPRGQVTLAEYGFEPVS